MNLGLLRQSQFMLLPHSNYWQHPQMYLCIDNKLYNYPSNKKPLSTSFQLGGQKLNSKFDLKLWIKDILLGLKKTRCRTVKGGKNKNTCIFIFAKTVCILIC